MNDPVAGPSILLRCYNVYYICSGRKWLLVLAAIKVVLNQFSIRLHQTTQIP